MSRWLRWVLGFILFVVLGLFCAQRINFAVADLGRHIKNGEFLFEHLGPISSNFYSYTEPQHPTINHHWASGAIFYLLWKSVGFKGLSLFYLLLNLGTFFLFFRVAEKESDFNFAFFFTFLSIPLMATRTEIRPEVFSYLLLGAYFYILYQFKEKRRGFKTLLVILPLLQILWTNLHIFFIMGPFLIGVFLCDSWFGEKDKDMAKRYLLLLIAATAVCLINPYGIKGALVPLTIFKEYGYMLAENQSVIFMQKRFLKPVYFYFEFLFLIVLISFVGILLRNGLKNYISHLFLMVTFSALSWRAIRCFPMFGLFFIPAASANFYYLLQYYPAGIKRIIQRFVLISPVVLLLIGIFFVRHHPLLLGTRGLGLMPGVQTSAYFFKQNHIQGPIFNNYDIGGYLIYHLFPDYRVFVDNRPEAYATSFFKDTYVPMQEDEGIWKKMDAKYNFNAIYFYRHDYTPWAQPFLIRRIQDSHWAPVFVDSYVLILLKRNAKNRQLIQLYELPREIFQFGRGDHG